MLWSCASTSTDAVVEGYLAPLVPHLAHADTHLALPIHTRQLAPTRCLQNSQQMVNQACSGKCWAQLETMLREGRQHIPRAFCAKVLSAGSPDCICGTRRACLQPDLSSHFRLATHVSGLVQGYSNTFSFANRAARAKHWLKMVCNMGRQKLCLASSPSGLTCFATTSPGRSWHASKFAEQVATRTYS